MGDSKDKLFRLTDDEKKELYHELYRNFALSAFNAIDHDRILIEMSAMKINERRSSHRKMARYCNEAAQAMMESLGDSDHLWWRYPSM